MTLWCCECGKPLPREEEEQARKAAKAYPGVVMVFKCLKCSNKAAIKRMVRLEGDDA